MKQRIQALVIEASPHEKALMKWEEFQGMKHKELRDVLKRYEKRMKYRRPDLNSLDRDMLPVILAWDDIPFSFTIEGCSGTPGEHKHKNGYSPVGGCKCNPHAYLLALSYMGHPKFNDFRDFLENNLSGKADISESHERDQWGSGGIYLHVINLWVPEKVQQSGDLEYLDRFWEGFETELERYLMGNARFVDYMQWKP
jgi:hypothetical protein